MLTPPDWYYDESLPAGVDYHDVEQVAVYDANHQRFRDYEAGAQAIMDRLALGPDATVLDMGAGTGAFTLHAAPHYRTVYAVDVSAAMLVSPSDVDWVDHIEDPLRDFAPMPLGRFPFKSVVVASRDDPYVKFERARFFAGEWGAEFVDIGTKGHINADTRLGDWPEGQAILNRLMG